MPLPRLVERYYRPRSTAPLANRSHRVRLDTRWPQNGNAPNCAFPNLCGAYCKQIVPDGGPYLRRIVASLQAACRGLARRGREIPRRVVRTTQCSFQLQPDGSAVIFAAERQRRRRHVVRRYLVTPARPAVRLQGAGPIRPGPGLAADRYCREYTADDRAQGHRWAITQPPRLRSAAAPSS